MNIQVPIDVIINEREKRRKKDRERPRKRIPVPEHKDDWSDHPEEKTPARGEVVIQM